MPTQAVVVWDPSFTAYDFGPEHPMSPVRLALTARLCEAFGLFDHDDVELVEPEVADDDLLEWNLFLTVATEPMRGLRCEAKERSDRVART